MADIIDINVNETVEEVTINVVDNVIQVNINKVTNTAGVPYVGATQDVNLGEFGLLTGNIELDNTPTNIPTTAGSIYWNDADGTADLILKGGNVKLQLGQEQVIRVVNKTATNVNLLESNYQAVRVTGAQGQRLKVDLAQATTDILSAETIGLVTENINNNQEGFITTSGLVRNVNTTGSLQSETWADGDILYLSPITAGMITKVKPSAPNHLVVIGYVIHAHATQGSIFVKVDNGYELDELHNVKIDTPLNNESLVYNSTLEVWENKAINLQRVLEAGGTSNNGEILLSYTGSDYRMFINGDQLLSYDITTNESISIIPPFITVNGTSNNLLIKPSKFEFLQGAFKTEITRVTPTANRVITFKDESGTVALTSDIPSPITIDATPTDGSSNAVSSNGVFDALALKQDDLWNFKNKGIILIDDFNLNNSNNFLSASALGGANPQPSTTYPNGTNQNGVVFINTSTSASGFSTFIGGGNYFLGAGAISYEVYANIETLSTSLERFINFFGFFTGSPANYINGVFFMYDEGGTFAFGANPASPNWKCVTINSLTRTFTTTSIPVTASAWVKLRIEINANASSVEFFIDNVSVATHTTNIPSTSTALNITNYIGKLIGTTNRQAYLDYAIYRQIFTTAR